MQFQPCYRDLTTSSSHLRRRFKCNVQGGTLLNREEYGEDDWPRAKKNKIKKPYKAKYAKYLEKHPVYKLDGSLPSKRPRLSCNAYKRSRDVGATSRWAA
ncbi:hypothetical protein PUN28_001783 [Cardiocondyla obscurior]|uniref:Uncharacterized protein n=1 Tax=Cardiocondyla obscurior TaxID=286306 RepID=A0AAW2GR42_9HYME